MTSRVIKFSATWCGPCRAYAPIFHEVEKNEKYNSIKFEEVDVDTANDEYEELMAKYSIRNIPATLILDENDNLIKKIIGLVSKNDLETEIENNLDKQEDEQ